MSEAHSAEGPSRPGTRSGAGVRRVVIVLALIGFCGRSARADMMENVSAYDACLRRTADRLGAVCEQVETLTTAVFGSCHREEVAILQSTDTPSHVEEMQDLMTELRRVQHETIVSRLIEMKIAHPCPPTADRQ